MAESFFDGFYLGQWCEAMHIHLELIHTFLPHTKPHQTQLHLKVKRPEQVFLRRALLLVSMPAGALLWVCISVCVCVLHLEKQILSLQNSCFSEKQAWMQHSVSLFLWMLGWWDKYFFPHVCRQPLLDSCRTVEHKLFASLWLQNVQKGCSWNSEFALVSAKTGSAACPLRHCEAGFVVMKQTHSGLFCSTQK